MSSNEYVIDFITIIRLLLNIELMSSIELKKNAIMSCHNYITVLQYECLLQKAPFHFLVKEAFIKKRWHSELTPASERVGIHPIERTNLKDFSAPLIDICSSLEN